uniref:Uncharacterized protein n=1 Tax=Meleagris gallopavo TaxID=9103 RepID=A0A803YKU8_MELGA
MPTDFEKRGKKEVCPILDQFLCHVAKTGETMDVFQELPTLPSTGNLLLFLQFRRL